MNHHPFQTIRTVARFERKTLLRSWFFRIFAGLFIFGIGIFNITVFVEGSDVPWLFRALPASLPYANLIILNLGQAIVAVFLASEFLKHDKKNDTTEVIYARSMTNLEYITGKTLGVLSVFILLNFIILFIGMGFSFLSNDSAKGIGEFFLYPLLISIPTLTFILGLSFFLMTLLRNQALTFIILLGYIGTTVFVLNTKFYHLFDYIGYHVPMLTSSITGFANLSEVLAHRGLYFLAGIGFILFTVYKIQRLPQSSRFNYLSLLGALLFFSSAIWLGYSYVAAKKGVVQQKNTMVELNNQYAFYPRVVTDSCTVQLEHHNKILKVKSSLKVVNKNKQSLDTLIFSLNPDLKLQSLKINGAETEYNRQCHLVLLCNTIRLQPGDTATVDFDYEGTINENTHMLDTHPDEYQDYLPLNLYKARKRFAFVQDDFVCLTSESLWYPISGVTYATRRPAYYQPDFARFKLTVKTRSDLTAVSQGQPIAGSNGTYTFLNEQPLPKISLLIGNYEKRSVQADSIEYSLYTIKGNAYYLKEFTNLSDTLPALIRELKNEYESLVELNYGYKRFAMAEVPLNFSLDKHLYTATSEAVQPEMVFYPEKGVLMEESDFRKRKKRFENQMKTDNEQITPEELQSRMFKQFVRRNLMGSPSDGYEFRNITDHYTWSLIPHYYTYLTQVTSEEWPVINLALEVFLRERNLTNQGGGFIPYWTINKGEKINLELKQASLKELLSQGKNQIEDPTDQYDPVTLKNLLTAKGDFLFSLFRARLGEQNFSHLINQIIAENQHRSFPLNQKMTDYYKYDPEKEIKNWYASKNMPGYLVDGLQTYKVVDKEYTKYQVRVKISNPSTVDGIVLVTINMDTQSGQRWYGNEPSRQPDYSKRVFIPAGSAVELGAQFQNEPKEMNITTGVSANLPNTLTYELNRFDDTKNNGLEGIQVIPVFSNLVNPNEFIVDNEDEGFSFDQPSNESVLRAFIKKSHPPRYPYGALNSWNPPGTWQPTLRTGFYGTYIKSAHYTAAGDGSLVARWRPDLPSGSYYDVYAHLNKVDMLWFRNRNSNKIDYHYKVYHDDGIEEIILSDEEIESGWNYLGTYFISPENARVELSNQSTGTIVIADAVKWEKK